LMESRNFYRTLGYSVIMTLIQAVNALAKPKIADAADFQ
jgi:hypothetical protein